MRGMRARAGIAALLLVAACAVTRPPLFVDDGGRGGTPIVFIHGNGGSSAQWQSQLAYFRAKGRRAIALDLPGFGRSNAPAGGDLSLDAMVASIDQSMSAMRVPRFVIAGHSYGGAVAAAYAAAHPEKVAGVIYVDAAASALPLTAEQETGLVSAIKANKMAVVRAWFAPMLKGSSEAVQQDILASVEKTPVDVFLGALLSLRSFDAKRLVNAYTGPRLAIAAADIETPAAFQRQFPEIPVTRISGTGHWVMLDKPDEVNAAIERFLESL
jgi:pimeloyl-ACP methyl ester carboxylesterase